MPTRQHESHATFTQTMPSDSLWLVTVSDGPNSNANFGVPGIDTEANANKLAGDLKARGYHSATVSQQGA